jgi:hypothetical protein
MQHVTSRLAPDGAIWLRILIMEKGHAIARNDVHYFVFYPGTNYVFVTYIKKAHLEIVCQAMMATFACDEIKQLDIKGRTLPNISAIVFNQKSQV